MTQPSPAAKPVWKAFYTRGLAAAVRALADQVVPAERHPDQDQFDGFADWDRAGERWEQRMATRRKILAIARKLEGRG